MEATTLRMNLYDVPVYIPFEELKFQQHISRGMNPTGTFILEASYKGDMYRSEELSVKMLNSVYYSVYIKNGIMTLMSSRSHAYSPHLDATDLHKVKETVGFSETNFACKAKSIGFSETNSRAINSSTSNAS